MKGKSLILLFAVLLIPACLYSAAVNTAAFVPYMDEILVVYKADFLNSDLETLKAKYGMKVTLRADVIRFMERKYDVSETRKYLPMSFFTCYKIPGIENMETIVESLKAEPIVEHVQPNYLFYKQTAAYTPITGGPADPYYTSNSQWYIN